MNSQRRYTGRPVALQSAGCSGLLVFCAVGLVLWALIIYAALRAFS